MRWRPYIIGGSVVALTGVNAFLVANEDIVGGPASETQQISREDPLLDLVFSPAARSSNLGRMGLTGALLSSTVERLDVLEKGMLERIDALIASAPDPDGLADALCGETRSGLRPRYGAMPWLIAEAGERRIVVDPGRLNELAEQEWAQTSPIRSVYAELELSRERQPDATLMGVMAILLRKEQDALEHKPPWGRGLFSVWDWGRVKRENPGADDLAREYFALSHLVLEVAHRDGGVCRR